MGMKCINCLHFKAKEGWDYASCSIGELMLYTNKERLFVTNWKAPWDERTVNDIREEIQERQIAALVRDCNQYEGMEDD